jgi:hypothetical protein
MEDWRHRLLHSPVLVISSLLNLHSIVNKNRTVLHLCRTALLLVGKGAGDRVQQHGDLVYMVLTLPQPSAASVPKLADGGMLRSRFKWL